MAPVVCKRVGGRELVDPVRLLAELEAWEQRTADEPPVASESRAHLMITLERSASRVWERVNEMAANNRLIRIKMRLDNL